MSIALITQPAFLQKHFFYTRQGLLGQWPPSGAWRRASELPPSEAWRRARELPKRANEAKSWRTAQELPAKNLTKSRVASSQLPEIETVSTLSTVIAESFAPHSEPSVAYQPDEIVQVPLEPIAVSTISPDIDRVPEPVTSQVITTVSKSRTSEKARPQDTLLKSITRFMLTVVIVISLGVGAVLILPEIYYTVFSQNTAVGEVADAAKNAADAQPTSTPEPQPYMPPQNPDLPTGAWMSIPRIGVNSELLPTVDSNEALDKGLWLVPDFGRPGDTTQPIIVAAHRFGWDWWWKTDYWKYHSFYLLTETEPGDRVEIIYDQRKWVYEIYAGEEGELITDYDADLILYTCKYLNSPIRYFRYAKLIEE